MSTVDLVNSPAHYQSESGLEVIDVINAFGLRENFALANTVKYVLRAGKKDSRIQDLKKARWYLDNEIRHCEKSEAEPETVAKAQPEQAEAKPSGPYKYDRGDIPFVQGGWVSVGFMKDIEALVNRETEKATAELREQAATLKKLLRSARLALAKRRAAIDDYRAEIARLKDEVRDYKAQISALHAAKPAAPVPPDHAIRPVTNKELAEIAGFPCYWSEAGLRETTELVRRRVIEAVAGFEGWVSRKQHGHAVRELASLCGMQAKGLSVTGIDSLYKDLCETHGVEAFPSDTEAEPEPEPAGETVPLATHELLQKAYSELQRHMLTGTVPKEKHEKTVRGLACRVVEPRSLKERSDIYTQVCKEFNVDPLPHPGTEAPR